MRVLVSKPDSLGDQIIAAGWLQALVAERPDALVAWHVVAGMEVVADLLPETTVFHPDETQPAEGEARRFQAAHPRGLVMVPFPLRAFADWTHTTGARLRWWAAFVGAQPWDLAVAAVGNRTWVAEATVAASGAPRRFGFAPTPARQTPVNEAGEIIGAVDPLFTETLPFNPERSERAQLGRLIAAAAGTPSSAEAPVRSRLAPAAEPRSREVLLAPGVGGPADRAWPAHAYAALADRLRADGWRVVWIEGPSDRAFVDPFRHEPGTTVETYAEGQLLALATRLARASALVCNDTAYAHLAAAIGTPTVAVFGGGQRERFHPGHPVKVVQGLPPCSGCQWHCLWPGMPCVSGVTTDAVYQAFSDLMTRGDASPVVRTDPLPGLPEDLAGRLQREVLALNADRFARLQIIQTLLEQLRHPAPAVRAEPPRILPRWSVIIPAGRADRVRSTLEALARQTPKPEGWEVVVVGAGLPAAVAEGLDLPLRTVPLAERAPPGATRAAGVAAARGDWYVFLDDDIEPEPDFLSRAGVLCAGHLAAGLRLGAVGARLPGKHGGFWEGITDISNFWSQQPPEAGARDWLYSAALIVSAAAYREAGGFDPAIAVGEDVDLTRRIAARGYTLRYEPSLIARHDHRRDTPAAMWRYFWRNGEGARYFFRAIGGTCPFSLKTVWLKTWSDFRDNRAPARGRPVTHGWRGPLVWLNYLIVETSLEWHWQRHIRSEGRHRTLPARTAADRTAARALALLDEGRRWSGSLVYARAMLEDFANPVRR